MPLYKTADDNFAHIRVDGRYDLTKCGKSIVGSNAKGEICDQCLEVASKQADEAALRER